MSQDKRCINCGNTISGHNSQTKNIVLENAG